VTKGKIMIRIGMRSPRKAGSTVTISEVEPALRGPELFVSGHNAAIMRTDPHMFGWTPAPGGGIMNA
jgi:hypothetical protein